jgi:DNA-binding response OmpR family regulator
MRTHRPTVLLIEDDDSTADVMAELLASNQFRVERAATAADAAAFAADHRVDLVILDLILPDADGLVFLIELRRHTDAPVIVCSASNRNRDAVLALRLGADDYVAKPFDIAELEERVRAVMRRAAPHRPVAAHAA